MRRVAFTLPVLVLVSACVGGGAMVAPEEEPFFVGRWAALPSLCDDGAWVFTATGVSTAGEVSCTFTSLTRTDSGYDAAGVCTAEGATSNAVISLAYAESAMSLLVEGGPFGPIGLIACPAGG